MTGERTRPGAITFEPIGVVRSPFLERKDAPRQPTAASDVKGRVELFPGRGIEDALSDLAAWDYVWLLVWFHHNTGFRPKVQPPRSASKRGVFATRSPYRPNPLGMSAVKLLAVEGLCLEVQGLDLLDGTPVLDIKPYVPYTDAIPGAGHGWLEGGAGLVTPEGERPADPLPGYDVLFTDLAEEQLAFLEAHGLALRPRVVEALLLGPVPHAYRRIRKEPEPNRYLLALKDFRVRFAVEARTVTVERLLSGYRPRELWSVDGGAPELHRSFAARWP